MTIGIGLKSGVLQLLMRGKEIYLRNHSLITETGGGGTQNARGGK